MSKVISLACDMRLMEIPLDKILPSRLIDEGVRKSSKYQCIKATIASLRCLVEPLAVFPQDGSNELFLLLDGHIRYAVLKELGFKVARCQISTDDEGYTYNQKVNRLSAVQEHFMIMKAIENGVEEAIIAKSLNVKISAIRQKVNMLDGICPEAVKLLRDTNTAQAAFREIRKVKPMRQIEIAELLRASGNYTVGYVKCLVITSPDDTKLVAAQALESTERSVEDISRVEHEMEQLAGEFRLIEESHGRNTLNLVLVVGYLKKLLASNKMHRFLTQQYPEILEEFRKMVDSRSLSDQVST